MSAGFSTYLNFLRISAALVVFLSHASYSRFGGPFDLPEHLDHEAVVVFFVLSGYVIAYVSAERERTAAAYLISRAARIFSVAIPALAITYAIDALVLHEPAYQLAAPWKYLPIFLTFTTDIWFLKLDAFSNAPYWSLCYEVWYYLIFAAAIFLRRFLRLAAIFCGLLIVGPRVWLLFPLWLAGVAVYRLHRGGGLPIFPARLIFSASLGILVAIWIGGYDLQIDRWIDGMSGGWIWERLRYSRYFGGDWLDGLIIALNIYAARYAGLSFGRARRFVDGAAAFSFTLYLVHFPLVEAAAHFHAPAWLLLAGVLIACWLVGLVTERQKDKLRQRLLGMAAALHIVA